MSRQMDNPSGPQPLDLGYSSPCQKHPGAQAALACCSSTAFRGSAQGTGHRPPCPSALFAFADSCPSVPNNPSLLHRVSSLPLLLATDTCVIQHVLSPQGLTLLKQKQGGPQGYSYSLHHLTQLTGCLKWGRGDPKKKKISQNDMPGLV